MPPMSRSETSHAFKLESPRLTKLSLAILLIFLLASYGGITPSVAARECADRILLEKPGWNLRTEGEAVEAYQEIEENALVGMESLEITLDLRGETFLPDDDAASIIIDDEGWYVANVTQYANNGQDGEQTITIPLSKFKGLGSQEGVPPNFEDGVDGMIHTRFWLARPYSVTISEIAAQCASPALGVSEDVGEQTPPPILTPEPAFVLENTKAFVIRSVDTMKLSKDAVCDQPTDEEIQKIVTAAKDMGANYVAIETPYDDPLCASSVAYTNRWIEAIRAAGLSVWHRHMPLRFEGIYDQPIEVRRLGDDLTGQEREVGEQILSVPLELLDQYQIQIYSYVLDNRDMFREGDIFTPSPEPDSRGVNGITGSSPLNQFSSVEDFNLWLINTTTIVKEAFEKIGLNDTVQVGFWGFSGFTAAGLDNSDWTGKTFLTCRAIDSMNGIVTLDHYSDQMQRDLEEAIVTLSSNCPNEFVNLMIGEYGADSEAQVREALQASRDLGLLGFNYWSTAGIQWLGDEGSPNDLFDLLQKYYLPQRRKRAVRSRNFAQ